MAKKKDASPEPSKVKKRPPPLTRDVGKQSKGPRLQKLRAVLLLVQATAHYPRVNALAAVELFGDVLLMTADASKSTEYVEENKNYDPSVAFTLNSTEVLNTLVAFCDFWICKGCSKHVQFGFYAPNNFTKESNTERTTKLAIDWPDRPMLEHLSALRFTEPKLLEAAKRSIIAEYEAQASLHGCATTPSNSALGHLAMIKGWTDGQWTDFLGQVQWKFGEDDADSILPAIFDAIQSSPAYNQQLAGKEAQIIALLIDRLDQRQAIADPTQRCMHVSEVILAFKEVETGAVRLPDPTWELWLSLPPPTDTRNIAGKVNAVCPTIAADKLARWARRATQSMIEQRALDDDKQVLALKYQIFDACEQKLAELRGKGENIDDARLDALMTTLLETATERYGHCSKQYHYKIASPPSIQAMVFELFDSCYLSFDGGPL